MKIIISGGGTGGHVFSAISIANALKVRYPNAEILFVGADNRMEMQFVPIAGYKIIGLPIIGFNRKNLFQNVFVIWKLLNSLFIARKIINDFNPNVVIGVGGYASAPILQISAKKGIPILIHEQNSCPGMTNKFLAKKAMKICVAYTGMEKFFQKEKIVITGNPVRQDLLIIKRKKIEGYNYFKLNSQKKTVLVIGGSLGSETINNCIISSIKIIEKCNFQLIWQHGCHLSSDIGIIPHNVYSTKFIYRMDLAYLIADLVVSRAGAGSVSELCLLGKPTIFVPSPNVTKNHQLKNAMVCLKKNAAVVVFDEEAVEKLIPKVLELIKNDNQLKILSKNILNMALFDSANRIVNEIISVI